jgi:hypothetical protein
VFDPSFAKLLTVLIMFVGIPVGAWYLIRSAVASGVRAGRRPEPPPPAPPADHSGSDPGSPS